MIRLFLHLASVWPVEPEITIAGRRKKVLRLMFFPRLAGRKDACIAGARAIAPKNRNKPQTAHGQAQRDRRQARQVDAIPGVT